MRSVVRPRGLILRGVVFLVLVATRSTLAEALPASKTEQVVGTTHGAVSGRVVDVSGAALARVMVRLSGAPLMAPRITFTSGDGHYLFVAVTPGVYAVEFTQPGFRSMTVQLQVGAASSTTGDVVLPLAGVAESVTIERSGVIDLHSTAVVERFSAAQLAALPNGRSMFAILSSTPGVQVARFDVGGDAADAGGPYSANGTRGLNRPMVEGINVAQLFPLGFTLDYGAFEEVSVGLAAHGPEWPLPGVYMQFVTKYGGNDYHGTAFAAFQHRKWQSHNINDEQRRRALQTGGDALSADANRMWRAYDLNGDLGGYIRRNLAWWYGSVRDQDIQTRYINFPVEPSQIHLRNYTGKLTVRPADGHNIIGFAQAGRNFQPRRLDPFGPSVAGGQVLNASTAIFTAVDATSTQRAKGLVWKVEWNATLGEQFFAEARVGQFGAARPLSPNGRAPRVEDVDTLRVTGGGRHSEERLRRDQAHASISFFKAKWTGSHHFKAGAELLNTVSDQGLRAAFPGDALHVVRNGKPTEVYRFAAPSNAVSGVFAAAGYVNDTWRLTDRLTVGLGVRFDRYRVFLPEQEHPRGGPDGQPVVFAAIDNILQWNLFAPRLGGVFDLGGDRKTVIKGGYGRYWLPPGDLGPNVNPNAPEWWERNLWDDANNTGVWEPGEEGPRLDSRGGRTTESIDPGLRPPWIDEATASAQRELSQALALRSGIVWRRDTGRYARHNTARPFTAFTEPVLVPDPGPDGIAGTADDKADLLAYNLRTDPSRPGGAANVVRNGNDAGSRYLTWDITVHRRPRGRWSLAAGFAHTWTLEHANAYNGQTVRQNVLVLTPNDLINTADAGRHRLRTWTATAWGTFQAPWNIALAPVLRHQSGQPFGRTFSAAMNYGTIRMLAEPIGTRRTENVTLADLRVEREFRGTASRRTSIVLDLFNLFNANAVQNVNWTSGPGFLQPLTIVAPRIARLGIKAAF